MLGLSNSVTIVMNINNKKIASDNKKVIYTGELWYTRKSQMKILKVR